MERLKELLNEITASAHHEGAYASRALYDDAKRMSYAVEEDRRAIIDHVASLVEAARKEGGGNG